MANLGDLFYRVGVTPDTSGIKKIEDELKKLERFSKIDVGLKLNGIDSINSHFENLTSTIEIFRSQVQRLSGMGVNIGLSSVTKDLEKINDITAVSMKRFADLRSAVKIFGDHNNSYKLEMDFKTVSITQELTNVLALLEKVTGATKELNVKTGKEGINSSSLKMLEDALPSTEKLISKLAAQMATFRTIMYSDEWGAKRDKNGKIFGNDHFLEMIKERAEYIEKLRSLTSSVSRDMTPSDFMGLKESIASASKDIDTLYRKGAKYLEYLDTHSPLINGKSLAQRFSFSTEETKGLMIPKIYVDEAWIKGIRVNRDSLMEFKENLDKQIGLVYIDIRLRKDTISTLAEQVISGIKAYTSQINPEARSAGATGGFVNGGQSEAPETPEKPKRSKKKKEEVEEEADAYKKLTDAIKEAVSAKNSLNSIKIDSVVSAVDSRMTTLSGLIKKTFYPSDVDDELSKIDTSHKNKKFLPQLDAEFSDLANSAKKYSPELASLFEQLKNAYTVEDKKKGFLIGNFNIEEYISSVKTALEWLELLKAKSNETQAPQTPQTPPAPPTPPSPTPEQLREAEEYAKKINELNRAISQADAKADSFKDSLAIRNMFTSSAKDLSNVNLFLSKLDEIRSSAMKQNSFLQERTIPSHPFFENIIKGVDTAKNKIEEFVASLNGLNDSQKTEKMKNFFSVSNYATEFDGLINNSKRLVTTREELQKFESSTSKHNKTEEIKAEETALKSLLEQMDKYASKDATPSTRGALKVKMNAEVKSAADDMKSISEGLKTFAKKASNKTAKAEMTDLAKEANGVSEKIEGMALSIKKANMSSMSGLVEQMRSLSSEMDTVLRKRKELSEKYGIQMHSRGGWVTGEGGSLSDSKANWLSVGEFVNNAASAKAFGPALEFFNALGNGTANVEQLEKALSNLGGLNLGASLSKQLEGMELRGVRLSADSVEGIRKQIESALGSMSVSQQKPVVRTIGFTSEMYTGSGSGETASSTIQQVVDMAKKGKNAQNEAANAAQNTANEIKNISTETNNASNALDNYKTTLANLETALAKLREHPRKNKGAIAALEEQISTIKERIEQLSSQAKKVVSETFATGVNPTVPKKTEAKKVAKTEADETYTVFKNAMKGAVSDAYKELDKVQKTPDGGDTIKMTLGYLKQVTNELRAAGSNADMLMKIFKKYPELFGKKQGGADIFGSVQAYTEAIRQSQEAYNRERALSGIRDRDRQKYYESIFGAKMSEKMATDKDYANYKELNGVRNDPRFEGFVNSYDAMVNAMRDRVDILVSQMKRIQEAGGQTGAFDQVIASMGQYIQKLELYGNDMFAMLALMRQNKQYVKDINDEITRAKNYDAFYTSVHNGDKKFVAEMEQNKKRIEQQQKLIQEDIEKYKKIASTAPKTAGARVISIDASMAINTLENLKRVWEVTMQTLSGDALGKEMKRLLSEGVFQNGRASAYKQFDTASQVALGEARRLNAADIAQRNIDLKNRRQEAEDRRIAREQQAEQNRRDAQARRESRILGNLSAQWQNMINLRDSIDRRSKSGNLLGSGVADAKREVDALITSLANLITLQDATKAQVFLAGQFKTDVSSIKGNIQKASDEATAKRQSDAEQRRIDAENRRIANEQRIAEERKKRQDERDQKTLGTLATQLQNMENLRDSVEKRASGRNLLGDGVTKARTELDALIVSMQNLVSAKDAVAARSFLAGDFKTNLASIKGHIGIAAEEARQDRQSEADARRAEAETRRTAADARRLAAEQRRIANEKKRNQDADNKTLGTTSTRLQEMQNYLVSIQTKIGNKSLLGNAATIAENELTAIIQKLEGFANSKNASGARAYLANGFGADLSSVKGNVKVAEEAAKAQKALDDATKKSVADAKSTWDKAISGLSRQVTSLDNHIGVLEGKNLDHSIIDARITKLNQVIEAERKAVEAAGFTADAYRQSAERIANDATLKSRYSNTARVQQSEANKPSKTSTGRTSGKSDAEIEAEYQNKLELAISRVRAAWEKAKLANMDNAKAGDYTDKATDALERQYRALLAISTGTAAANKATIDASNRIISKANADISTQTSMNASENLRGVSSYNSQLKQMLHNTFSLDQQFSNLAMTIGNTFSLVGIQQFAKQIINIGGELEKQNLAMESILGDASKAREIYSQVSNLSMISPFTVQDLVKNTKQLSAFGVKYDDLYDTVKRLSDISAAVGVDFGRIAYEYGQMETMGYLDRRHLRMFSMSGVPLMSELRRYYSNERGGNVSQHDVDKMIMKREVSADVVKDILRQMTDEGGKFYNMQEIMAESLVAKYANLTNAWNLMLGEMAESAPGDLLKNFASMLTEFTRQWKIIGTIGGSAGILLLFAKLNPLLAIASSRMGDFSSEFAKTLQDKSTNKAQELRTAGIFRTLTTEEKSLIASSGKITDAQLAKEKEITKVQAAQLYLRKQITAEQLKNLETEEGKFTDGELNRLGIDKKMFGTGGYVDFGAMRRSLKNGLSSIKNTLLHPIDSIVGGYKRVAGSIKSVTAATWASIKAFKISDVIMKVNAMAGQTMARSMILLKVALSSVGSALSKLGATMLGILTNPVVWIFAIVGAVTHLISSANEAQEKTRELLNAFDEMRKKAIDSLDDVIKRLKLTKENIDAINSGKGVEINANLDFDQLRAGIEDSKEIIKELNPVYGELFKEVFAVGADGKYIHSMEERLAMLEQEILRLKDVYEGMDKFRGLLDIASKATNSDWEIDDDIVENLKDLGKAETSLQTSLGKAIGSSAKLFTKEYIDELSKSGIDNAELFAGITDAKGFVNVVKALDNYEEIIDKFDGILESHGKEFIASSKIKDIVEDYRSAFDEVKDDAKLLEKSLDGQLSLIGINDITKDKNAQFRLRIEVENFLDQNETHGAEREAILKILEDDQYITKKVVFEEQSAKDRNGYFQSIIDKNEVKNEYNYLGELINRSKDAEEAISNLRDASKRKDSSLPLDLINLTLKKIDEGALDAEEAMSSLKYIVEKKATPQSLVNMSEELKRILDGANSASDAIDKLEKKRKELLEKRERLSELFEREAARVFEESIPDSTDNIADTNNDVVELTDSMRELEEAAVRAAEAITDEDLGITNKDSLSVSAKVDSTAISVPDSIPSVVADSITTSVADSIPSAIADSIPESVKEAQLLAEHMSDSISTVILNGGVPDVIADSIATTVTDGIEKGLDVDSIGKPIDQVALMSQAFENLNSNNLKEIVKEYENINNDLALTNGYISDANGGLATLQDKLLEISSTEDAIKATGVVFNEEINNAIKQSSNWYKINDNLNKLQKEYKGRLDAMSVTYLNLQDNAKKAGKSIEAYAKSQGLADVVRQFSELSNAYKQIVEQINRLRGTANPYQERLLKTLSNLDGNILSEEIKASLEEAIMSGFDSVTIDENVDKVIGDIEKKYTSVVEKVAAIEIEAKEKGFSGIPSYLNNLLTQDKDTFDAYTKVIDDYNRMKSQTDVIETLKSSQGTSLTSFQKKLKDILDESNIQDESILSGTWVRKLDNAIKSSIHIDDIADGVNSVYKDLKTNIDTYKDKEDQLTGSVKNEYDTWVSVKKVIESLAAAGGFKLDDGKKGKKSAEEKFKDHLDDISARQQALKSAYDQAQKLEKQNMSLYNMSRDDAQKKAYETILESGMLNPFKGKIKNFADIEGYKKQVQALYDELLNTPVTEEHKDNKEKKLSELLELLNIEIPYDEAEKRINVSKERLERALEDESRRWDFAKTLKDSGIADAISIAFAGAEIPDAGITTFAESLRKKLEDAIKGKNVSVEELLANGSQSDITNRFGEPVAALVEKLRSALQSETQEMQSAYVEGLKEVADFALKYAEIEIEYQKKITAAIDDETKKRLVIEKNAKQEQLRIDQAKRETSAMNPSKLREYYKNRKKELDAYDTVVAENDKQYAVNSKTGSKITLEAWKSLQSEVDSLQNSTDKAAESFRKLWRWIRGEKNGIGTGFNDIANGLRDSITELEKFTQKIEKIGELTGSRKTVNIGKLGSSILSSTSKTFDAIGKFNSGDYIGGADSASDAMLELASTIKSIKEEEEEEARRVAQEKKQEKNERLRNAIEDLTQTMKDATSVFEKIVSYETAINLNNRQIKDAQKELQDNALHTNAHHSINKKLNLTDYDYESINKALKTGGVFTEEISKKEQLWMLSPEQWKAIRDYAFDTYDKIASISYAGDDTLDEELNNIIALADSGKNIIREFYESVTGISFDSLVSNFHDALMDMNSTAQDFSDSFTEIMFESLINNFVLGKEFTEWLENWYKDFTNVVSDETLSDEERARKLNELNNQAVDERNKLIQDRDYLADLLGYTGNSSSSSLTSSISGISEETADLLASYINSMRSDLSIQRGAVEQIRDYLLDGDVSSIPSSIPIMNTPSFVEDTYEDYMIGIEAALAGQTPMIEALAYEQLPLLNATATAQLAQLNQQTEYLRMIQESNQSILDRVDVMQNDLHGAVIGTKSISVN